MNRLTVLIVLCCLVIMANEAMSQEPDQISPKNLDVESVKASLDTENLDPVEGIWKLEHKGNNSYLGYFLVSKNKLDKYKSWDYSATVIESSASFDPPGKLKFLLRKTESPGAFYCAYFFEPFVGSLTKKDYMTFDGSTMRFNISPIKTNTFIKVYP